MARIQPPGVRLVKHEDPVDRGGLIIEKAINNNKTSTCKGYKERGKQQRRTRRH